MRPHDVAVGIVDVHDAPVQGLVSDQAAGDLNLGKLWHRISSTLPRTCTRWRGRRPAGRLTRMDWRLGRSRRTPLPGWSGPAGAVHARACAPGTGASLRE